MTTPTVLITGCSSGFGLETARLFHDRGWSVVATMRTPRDGLLPVSDRMRVLPLDVTDAASIAAAVQAAGPLDRLAQHPRPVRLHPLRDQNVCAGQNRAFRVSKAAYLMNDADSCVLKAANKLGIDVPEQHHPRHVQLKADADLLLEKRRVRGGGDQINGKVFHTGGAQGLDLVANPPSRFAQHAQHREASGVGGGGALLGGEVVRRGQVMVTPPPDAQARW